MIFNESVAIIVFQPVKISYASEKNAEGKLDDPVKDTYFYTKSEPWKAIKGDSVSINHDNAMILYKTMNVLQPTIKKSELVCPTKFVLEEKRIYGSPSKHEEVFR